MMADGNVLEDVLHFRRDSLDMYFQRTAQSISPLLKFVARPFSPLVKWWLLAQSEPYKACKTRNILQMKHFFKPAVMPASGV